MHWQSSPPKDADYDIWLWKEDQHSSVWPYVLFWAVKVIDDKPTKMLVAQAGFEDLSVKIVSKMGGLWAGPVEIPEN